MARGEDDGVRADPTAERHTSPTHGRRAGASAPGVPRRRREPRAVTSRLAAASASARVGGATSPANGATSPADGDAAPAVHASMPARGGFTPARDDAAQAHRPRVPPARLTTPSRHEPQGCHDGTSAPREYLVAPARRQRRGSGRSAVAAEARTAGFRSLRSHAWAAALGAATATGGAAPPRHRAAPDPAAARRFSPPPRHRTPLRRSAVFCSGDALPTARGRATHRPVASVILSEGPAMIRPAWTHERKGCLQAREDP